MTGQEALTLVDNLLRSANLEQGLNDLQSTVFLETWAGRSYQDISQESGYEYDYIKQVGSRLWRLITQLFGEKVSKHNIQAVLRRYQQSEEYGTFILTSHLSYEQLDFSRIIINDPDISKQKVSNRI